MKNLTILLYLCACASLAQVGIGTTNPNATLDIVSSNEATPSNTDGLLIPKVDEFPITNPTTAQDGMMVYATGNGSITKGFYYWNETLGVWVIVGGGNDHDWYRSGTTTVADTITNSIYTNGRVSIGTPYSNDGVIRVLDSIARMGVIIEQTGNSGTAQRYGFAHLMDVDGTGAQYGFYGVLDGDGASHRIGASSVVRGQVQQEKTGYYSGVVMDSLSGPSSRGIGAKIEVTGYARNLSYGIKNTIASRGGLTRYGIHNHVGGVNASSADYGVYNEMEGFATGAVRIYGVRNAININNSSNQYGVFNSLFGNGSASKHGMRNTLSGSGDGWFHGIQNILAGDGIGRRYGIENTITGDGSGLRHGVKNTITGDGIGNQIGVESTMTGSGTGNKFGVDNSIDHDGISGHVYGVRNTISATGAGFKHGVENRLNVRGNGTTYGIRNTISGTDNSATADLYGTYNLIQNRGTGDKYAIYNVIIDTIPGEHYGTYNDVRKSDGYAGYFLGRVSIGAATTDNYILPLARGTIGQVIQTDGIGNTSWVDETSIGSERINDLSDGKSDTNGSSVYLGMNAGTNDDGTDNENVGVGLNTLSSNISGTGNTSIGFNNMANNTIGSINIAIGAQALTSNLSGNNNNAIGVRALVNNGTGNGNIAIGTDTGRFNNGDDNVFIGTRAGYQTSISNISNSIFIGHEAGYNSMTSNRLHIESSNSTTPLIYGEFDSNILGFNGDVGIGHQSPQATLHIKSIGSSGNPTIVAALESVNSARPILQFSETNIINSLAGMSLEYNGTGASAAKKMVVNAVGGTGVVEFMNGGNLNILNGDLVIEGPGTDKELRIDDNAGNNDRVLMRQNGTQDIYIGDIDNNGGDTYIRAGGSTDVSIMAGTGYVGINTTNPSASLHINHPSGAGSQGLVLSNTVDADEWRMYHQWNSNTLSLFHNNTNVGNFDDVTGIYSAISDRRLKNNIEPTESILDRVKKLKVMNYNFKFQKDSKKHIGLIAQEVEQIFPHLVEAPNQETTTYTMDYSGFGVLAIKAIQEQEKIIQEQQIRLNILEAELKEIKSLLKN